MIDRATFQRVQDKFGSALKVYHAPQLTYAGGLITCGHCGHIVTGEKKLKRSPDGTKRQYSYYRCSRYNHHGHPRLRLNERQIDRQLLGFFDSMRVGDPTMRQLWIDLIKAKSQVGFAQNREHQAELLRQREQVNAKLQKLLDLRMDGEITADEYATKRQELYERQSAVALQLQTSDVDSREIADLAIKAFELTQSLKDRWVTADYKAKRAILGIVLKNARLNSQNVEFSLKLPYEKLRDARCVPLSGAMGI